VAKLTVANKRKGTPLNLYLSPKIDKDLISYVDSLKFEDNDKGQFFKNLIRDGIRYRNMVKDNSVVVNGYPNTLIPYDVSITTSKVDIPDTTPKVSDEPKTVINESTSTIENVDEEIVNDEEIDEVANGLNRNF
jgi:hypothetical protein